MNQQLTCTVVIQDPQGLHMRPMATFVQRANQFKSQVALRKADLRVNGKSMFELLMLGAEQGTTLELYVDGPDASEALEALAAILTAPSLPEPPETS